MEWNVQFLMAGTPTEDQLIGLQERYDEKGLDATVTALPDTGQWTISFGVRALSYEGAVNSGTHDLDLFHGPMMTEPIGMEVLTVDELERRAAEPTMPPLVGASEVAELLGVSRQRVHQLRSHPEFPAPLVEVAMGPLWDERAVEKFARDWERKPGRPAGPTVRISTIMATTTDDDPLGVDAGE